MKRDAFLYELSCTYRKVGLQICCILRSIDIYNIYPAVDSPSVIKVLELRGKMWQNNSCAPLEICSSAFGLVVWAAAVGFITSIKV